MINVYDAWSQNFDRNGLGIIDPIQCDVEEIKNGMYSATVKVPMREKIKNDRIAAENIFKIPCPTIPVEAYFESERIDDDHWSVLQSSYNVTNLLVSYVPHMNGNTYGYYTGTLIRVDDYIYNNYYARVKLNFGLVAYVLISQLPTATKTYVTVGSDENYLIPPDVYRDQLFRIKEVETDTTGHTINAEANHVFYELEKSVCNFSVESAEYATFDAMLRTDISGVYSRVNNPFIFLSRDYIPSDYPIRETDLYKTEAQYLLDEKNGFVNQFGYTMIRDNYRIILLKDDELAGSVSLQTGKNIEGVVYKNNVRDLVMRVMPIGDKTGSGGRDVHYSGVYVDSPKITGTTYYRMYPAKVIKYSKDVQGSNTSNGLFALAQKEFSENHIDEPKINVSVDYSGVVDRAFERFRKTICMGNSINVVDDIAHIDVNVELTRYVWDATPFAMRHKEIELGDLINLLQGGD